MGVFGKFKVISLRIPEKIDEILEEISERKGVSKSEIIRTAVLAFLHDTGYLSLEKSEEARLKLYTELIKGKLRVRKVVIL